MRRTDTRSRPDRGGDGPWPQGSTSTHPGRRTICLTVTLCYGICCGVSNDTFTVAQLAEAVNDWCDEHKVAPASGQAGQRMTERNVRYYRTLGLIDPPLVGGGMGYGEKHFLQLIAVRLLQAQGLPL